MTTIPRKKYFKSCEEFSICAIKCDKNWIGIEQEDENYGLYHFCVYGSAKFGVPFQSTFEEVKSNDFFDMKKYLNGSIMLEALEDFYWIGFNTKDKGEDWDGKLINTSFTPDKDSWIICFDGHPIVNGKTLSRFDYAQVSTSKNYDVTINGGSLALFTKN